MRYLSLVAEQVALAVDNALHDEELRKQKAHFEKLFELAPEAIVLRDIENRVLRANKEFTNLFGYTLEEAVGRNISELIVPDGLWEEVRKAAADAEVRGAGGCRDIRKRKDGSRIVVSLVAASVCVDGGASEIYGIYRDITERKQAEETLKRSEAYLAEGQRLSHTGSWARSVSTGDIFFSEESFRIFGFDPKKTKMTLALLLSRVHPD